MFPYDSMGDTYSMLSFLIRILFGQAFYNAIKESTEGSDGKASSRKILVYVTFALIGLAHFAYIYFIYRSGEPSTSTAETQASISHIDTLSEHFRSIIVVDFIIVLLLLGILTAQNVISMMEIQKTERESTKYSGLLKREKVKQGHKDVSDDLRKPIPERRDTELG